MTSSCWSVLAMGAALLATSAHGKSCEQMKELALPDTSIDSTEMSSGDFKDPAAPWMQPVVVPAHCRVRGTIKPTPDSDIQFEVWLPAEQWNGKLQGNGNGDFAGSINQLGLALSVQRGYAAASTDTGHVSIATAPDDQSWAKGHPEKIVDYGHRAIHLMTVNAKAIVKAFYGDGPKRSYFASCSNGGRQALMTAQRYPEDYDGIVAGAPAHDWTHLMIGMIWNANALSRPGAFIPPTLAPAIQAAVNQQCDALDGVSDGVVAAPQSCNFDAAKLLCPAGKSDGCLQQPQVDALRAIYRGPRTSADVRLYSGFVPGAEVGTPVPGMGWDGWIFGDAAGNSVGARFGKSFMRDFVTGDQSWELTGFNFDRDPPGIDARFAPILNATDPDLTRFAARGGKLILFHGMADAAIPVGSTIDYFESVGKKMGSAERDAFTRLFLAPGMQHCFGGPGPSAFGGNGPADQPADPSADLSAAVEAWVEKGSAPSSVRAIKPKNVLLAFTDVKQAGVERSGLLCAYPKHAQWQGKGEAGDAANYTCK